MSRSDHLLQVEILRAKADQAEARGQQGWASEYRRRARRHENAARRGTAKPH